MRLLFKAHASLARTGAPLSRSLQQAHNHHCFPKGFSTLLATQNAKDDEMGKDKVNYQLKTPKGTKDCTSSSSRLLASPLTLNRGGKGYGNPRPDFLHHYQRLQTPRRSNDRYVRYSIRQPMNYLPRTDTAPVLSSSSAKSLPANTAKTASSYTTLPIKAARYVLSATISLSLSLAGWPKILKCRI